MQSEAKYFSQVRSTLDTTDEDGGYRGAIAMLPNNLCFGKGREWWNHEKVTLATEARPDTGFSVDNLEFWRNTVICDRVAMLQLFHSIPVLK